MLIKSYCPDQEFKAFLFDFDGTIADTMGAHLLSWNKALEIYNVSISREQHFSWAGRPSRQILQLVNELHGLNIDADSFMKGKEVHYLALLDQVLPVTPVVDIIRHYADRTPMAIVSGGRRKMVQRVLKHLALEKHFNILICAEDYTNGKPDPEGFLKAAGLLSVDPRDCLVFEDAPLGIEAARRAGMTCLKVETSTGKIVRI